MVLDIVTEGMKSNYIDENSTVLVGNIPLGFDNTIKSNGIKLRKQNKTIEWSANFPIRSLEMSKMREARQDELNQLTPFLNNTNSINGMSLKQLRYTKLAIVNLL